MKTIIYLLVAGLLLVSACKKESSTTTSLGKSDLVGNWEGRYSLDPNPLMITMAKMIFDADGNATVTDSVGNMAIKGNYTISGDSVIVDVSYGGIAHAIFRFKMNAARTAMDGKWGNLLASVSGLVQQTKKSSTLISKANMEGTWFGRYSFDPSPTFSTAAYFYFDAAGNTILTDSIGGQVFNGTYTLSGDSLVTTVTRLATTVNFRFRVTKADARLDGLWFNYLGAVSGKIYEDRK